MACFLYVLCFILGFKKLVLRFVIKMVICPPRMNTTKDSPIPKPKGNERPSASVLLPLNLPPAGSLRKGRDLFASCFFLAFLGLATAAFSLDVGGRAATAGTPEKATKNPPLTAVQEEGRVPSLKKSRKMEPSESMGISLSIESSEAEAQQETQKENADRSPAGEKKTARKKAAGKKQGKKQTNAGRSVDLKVVKPRVKTADSLLLAEAEKKTEAKDWKGAVGVYNKILKKEPNNRIALEGKIYALGQNGSDKALELLDEIAEKHPEIASLHAARARILVRQNDTKEALEAWRKAVEIEPEKQDYRLGLAVLIDRLGEGAEALILYRQLRKPWPEEVKSRVDYLSSKDGSRSR